jgi:hypothetical protein
MSRRKCFATVKPRAAEASGWPQILLSSRSVLGASCGHQNILAQDEALTGIIGLWISARSRSSKNESWIFPASTNWRMAGARSAGAKPLTDSKRLV